MAEALEQRGADGWDQRYHTRLMRLLGHPPGTHIFHAGELERASFRLVGSRKPGNDPLPAERAEATAAALRRRADEELGRLRQWRRELPDRSRDRLDAMAAASTDISAEARLRHRYEMEHERSLYRALRELKALAKSGLDLPEEPEPDPGPESGPSPGPEAAPEAVAATPAAPGVPEISNTNTNNEKTCVELASVGETTSTGGHPEGPSASPGRPGGPSGADRGPKRPPKRF
jgi:hypothetical protein